MNPDPNLWCSYASLSYVDLPSNSNKFYTVFRVNEFVVLHYGRVGTAGQSNIVSFSSSQEAERVATAKIGDKLAKGYLLNEELRLDGVTDPTLQRFLTTGWASAAVEALHDEVDKAKSRRQSVAPSANQPLHERVKTLLTRASEDAGLDELMERWGEVRAAWARLEAEYEAAQPLIAEAQQVVANKLLGG